MSGFSNLFKNINKFIEKKKVLGKCTTSLYKLEQILDGAMDEVIDALITADRALKLAGSEEN